MVKITKEEFERLQPRCQCPCNLLLEWKEYYKWYGLPEYKIGHNNTNRTIILTKEEFERTGPHYCECGCNMILSWKKHYKWYGIPKRIYGHKSWDRTDKKLCEEHKSKDKNNNVKWYKKNKEYKREYNKHYRNTHSQLIKEGNKKYYEFNREKVSESHAKYNLKNPEYRKNHYKQHPEGYKRRNKKHKKTPKGKISNARQFSKRKRELGYNSLNDWFEGCEGHHINKIDVIFIPKNINTQIYHNVHTGKNMDIVNTMAYFFLVMQNIDKIKKLFN